MREWWQDGIIYQIYPRSFADSNGDGIGDLEGVISKLDYLQALGIDGIWFSPFYPSPMHDFGYDVADYCAIADEFGTLDTFERLVDEAHRRNIRIVIDLVFNHCSSEHPWFKEACESRTSPKRDWFIWHDGKKDWRGKRTPPNNWGGAFGGSAWTWHEPTGQFYCHGFLAEQPDLNWRNPEVREALYDVIRFWLDRGVDGFRLDVVNWFIKDDQFRSNPIKTLLGRPYDRQDHIYDRNRPETIDYMKGIRAVVDEYASRMTVGEVFVPPPGDPELPARYYGEGDGLHMAFNFAFLYRKWKASAFRDAVARWESLLGQRGWPNYTLSNHDQPRHISRFGKGGDQVRRARLAALMLLTLRGTPFLYYGEEIGMGNGKVPKAKLQDPVGIRYWPFHPGRDPARTPMCWDASEGAGFTDAEPWLPLNADAGQINVAAQEDDPASLLNWYRQLISLRRGEPALHAGDYTQWDGGSDDLFCYMRSHGEDRLLIVLNFADQPVEARLPKGDWQALTGPGGAAQTTIRCAPEEGVILKKRGAAARATP